MSLFLLILPVDVLLWFAIIYENCISIWYERHIRVQVQKQKTNNAKQKKL